MTAYAGCAGLARSPFVLTEHISSPIVNFKFARLGRSPFVLTEHMTSWRASEASETLSGVTQSRFRYIYLFIYLYGT